MSNRDKFHIIIVCDTQHVADKKIAELTTFEKKANVVTKVVAIGGAMTGFPADMIIWDARPLTAESLGVHRSWFETNLRCRMKPGCVFLGG